MMIIALSTSSRRIHLLSVKSLVIYMEGDTSLRRTIDSLAQKKYDDKRKLLVSFDLEMIDLRHVSSSISSVQAPTLI